MSFDSGSIKRMKKPNPPKSCIDKINNLVWVTKFSSTGLTSGNVLATKSRASLIKSGSQFPNT